MEKSYSPPTAIRRPPLRRRGIPPESVPCADERPKRNSWPNSSRILPQCRQWTEIDNVLNAQTWYQTEASMDTGTDQSSGSLFKHGESNPEFTWSGLPFQVKMDNLNQVGITNGTDTEDERSPLNIDNVTLTTGVIPEPSSLLLIVLGAVTMLNRRPRRTA